MLSSYAFGVMIGMELIGFLCLIAVKSDLRRSKMEKEALEEYVKTHENKEVG